MSSFSLFTILFSVSLAAFSRIGINSLITKTSGLKKPLHMLTRATYSSEFCQLFYCIFQNFWYHLAEQKSENFCFCIFQKLSILLRGILTYTRFEQSMKMRSYHVFISVSQVLELMLFVCSTSFCNSNEIILSFYRRHYTVQSFTICIWAIYICSMSPDGSIQKR